MMKKASYTEFLTPPKSYRALLYAITDFCHQALVDIWKVCVQHESVTKGHDKTR